VPKLLNGWWIISTVGTFEAAWSKCAAVAWPRTINVMDERHRRGTSEKSTIEPRALMEAAINEMRLSKSEGGKPTPVVGAVALLPDGSVVRSHRSELRNGDHAEYTLFERKLHSQALDEVRLFVTLEPCAPGARSAEKTPCAQRIVDARITEVWIGTPDPYPTVAGKGRAFLEHHGITVHAFDEDLRDVILAENAGFLVYAEGVIRAESAGRALVERVRKLVADPSGRIELNDCIVDEVERLRRDLEGPLPTTMVEPEDFAQWLDALTVNAAPLVGAFALVGYWGRADDVPILLRALERLTRWRIAGGIAIVLNSRIYPPLMALYAAGVAAVAAGRYDLAAALLCGRLPLSTLPYPRPDEMLPVPEVLNGPEVLDRVEIEAVLNIGAGRRDHFAPESVYIQGRLRSLMSDLIRGDDEFERAFDTFEALLGLRYIVEGGAGLPAGSYTYRGRRSFGLAGVPERLRAELDRDGPRWPPVAAGVFESVDEARRALDAMAVRLATSTWTSSS
jgi:pyrimidine deaminase RibD-like protein